MNKQQRDIVETGLRILGCSAFTTREKHVALHGMTMVAIPMQVHSREFGEIRVAALHMVLDKDTPGWRDDG